jgi:hypothetical protein
VAAEWRSNLGAFLGATDRGIKAGLIAAAETYMAPVKERLLKGYTSGDFTTGNIAGSVARGEPVVTGDGAEIAVGSTQTDPPYALYWELGHYNVFMKGNSVMGGLVRIPVWEPIMVEMRERLVKVAADEIRAVDNAL